MRLNVIALIAAPVMGFAICAAVVPLAEHLARKFSVSASPRDNASSLIPLWGGLGIMAGALATAAVCAPALWLVAALPLMLLGAVDDAHALRPAQKAAGQTVAAAAAYLALPHFFAARWGWLAGALFVFWCVAASNAYNLIDGLDGLASVVGIAAGLAVAAAALLHGAVPLAIQALALAGALAGFLIYNTHPASIFMGDCGALPIGLMLGVMAVQAGALPASSYITVFAFPVLVLLIPLFDTAIVSATRLATGKRISRRGLDHCHHRLLRLGLNDRTVMMVCFGGALVTGGLAVAASILPIPYLIMLLIIVSPVVMVGAFFLGDLSFEVDSPETTYKYARGAARLILDLAYKRRAAEPILDAFLIAAAYFSSWFLYRDFAINRAHFFHIASTLPIVLAVSLLAFFVSGVYRGVWRQATLIDAVRLALGAVVASATLAVLARMRVVAVPRPVIVQSGLLLADFLVASRMSFRLLREFFHSLAAVKTRVLIVGVDRHAHHALSVVPDRRSQRVIGFVDDDSFLRGRIVSGRPVLGSLDDLEPIYRASAFHLILVTCPLSPERSLLVQNFAARHRIALTYMFMRSGGATQPPAEVSGVALTS